MKCNFHAFGQPMEFEFDDKLDFIADFDKIAAAFHAKYPEYELKQDPPRPGLGWVLRTSDWYIVKYGYSTINNEQHDKQHQQRHEGGAEPDPHRETP